MTIKQWPVAERPREKLLQKGPASLSDAELLAIFLCTGTRGKSAIDLARQTLVEYGSLRAIVDAKMDDLCRIHGLGPAKYILLQAAMELGKRYLESILKTTDVLTDPKSTRDYLSAQLSHYPHEVFACIFLNNRHHVISFDKMFTGTIDGASVYPREVVKQALACNAAAIIFAHNHPSGIAEPSQADIQLTRRLKAALELVDIRVLDHFVIGAETAVSLAERGLI